MSMAVYPLGIPMLLNPIGIVALTLFSAEAQKLVDLAALAVQLILAGLADVGVITLSGGQQS